LRNRTDYEVERVSDGYFFPEGIRWHRERVWFGDVRGAAVWVLDPAVRGARPRRIAMAEGACPAGLGWLPDGRLLVADMPTRRVLRVEQDGTIATHATLSPSCRGFANDAIHLSDGTFVVGDMGIKSFGALGSDRFPGRLLVVSPDGKVAEVIDDLDTPNGIAVPPDESCLILAETLRSRLTVFPLAGSTLGEPRTFAVLGDPKDPRSPRPDGICLDSAGAVWVANLYGREVIRVADGGEILERIPTPDVRPTSCVLGGPGRQDLFITAVEAPNQEEVMKAPTGIVMRVTVDVPGAGRP